MIKLTEKEKLLLKDLKNQEQLCVDKYTAASSKAKAEDLIYVGGSMYVLAELLTNLGYGETAEE